MAPLSGDLIVALCDKPCRGPITWGQRRLLPDGSVEVSGERLRPLCGACPERDNPEVRHVEVLHGFPPGQDVWEVGDTESAAREHEGTAVLRVVYDDP
jgi:hypothetical protein